MFDNLDGVDRDAIRDAEATFTARLARELPQFDWRTSIELREQPNDAAEHEAAEYLQWGRAQRDLRGWDYVFVFVRPDLNARQRPHAWACISRSLDSAVVSTARIDPRAEDPQCDDQRRRQALARRVEILALRSLGHLCGLNATVHPDNVMGEFRHLQDLDRGNELLPQQIDRMAANLPRIADLRLEEERSSQPLPWWTFLVKAAWRNRREIAEGLLQARPWQMPFRLAGLTLAALTTMLILMMTAEAWELGTSQSPAMAVGLSLVAMGATTAYVLGRQGLILHERHVGRTEQVVTTNCTTIAIVATGIATTYGMLLLLTAAVCSALFRDALVASWAPTLQGPVRAAHYWIFAAFVSSFGIVIGALGASFQGQNYFRHITFVDEEV